MERILGTRQKQTPGADGALGQTTIEVTDSCWDLPVEKTLRRWLQNCPRALAEVLAFQARMHDRAMAEHGTVVALVDLCDGDLYRGHPVLGDAARRTNPTHKRSIPGDSSSPWVPVRMPLSIVLYYDDVECAQPHTTATHRTPLAPHALNTVPISLDRPANSLGHARVVHSWASSTMRSSI